MKQYKNWLEENKMTQSQMMASIQRKGSMGKNAGVGGNESGTNIKIGDTLTTGDSQVVGSGGNAVEDEIPTAGDLMIDVGDFVIFERDKQRKKGTVISFPTENEIQVKTNNGNLTIKKSDVISISKESPEQDDQD